MYELEKLSLKVYHKKAEIVYLMDIQITSCNSLANAYIGFSEFFEEVAPSEGFP
jgi:hypothetical protein